MDLQLKDKVVLITGGAKGIGTAITRAAVQEGAIPVIIDRDAHACEKIVSELKLDRVRGHHVVVELQSAGNCAEAVNEAVGVFRRIDALVNNAGVNDGIGLEHGNPEKFVALLQLHLLHYYNTKGAILAQTREWAVELLPYSIRVNAVVPAEVMTPLYEQWLGKFPDPEVKLNINAAKIPLGKRMTIPDEIAAMVLFLISGQASHITRQHMCVDGGYVHPDRALT